jgi:hypothetical protein
MIYESGTAVFTASKYRKVVALEGDYTTKPTVTVTVCEGTNNDINAAIKDITTTVFTIVLSDVPGASLTVSYIVLGE